MSMPNNLLFVRHGQSEANILQTAAKKGDESLYTDSTYTVPDRSWRLSPVGVRQASTIGRYIQSLFPQGFDRYFVSPYTRTRETAAMLGLEQDFPRQHWEENRIVRERFWGEIGSMPLSTFLKEYPRSAMLKKIDPLYWAPPGGESIAEVCDSRVHGLLDTLHREDAEHDVIVVTHGEFMWASMLNIERWSDEEFVHRDKDRAYKLHNCMTVHYTRIDPVTGEQAGKLRWVRRFYPSWTGTGGSEEWTVVSTDWEQFDKPVLSNGDLLEKVKTQPSRIGC